MSVVKRVTDEQWQRKRATEAEREVEGLLGYLSELAATGQKIGRARYFD